MIKKPRRKKHSKSSSSSGRTEKSKASKEVLELGREIVRQFDPNNDGDTLAAWIAQDLAEKLKKHAAAAGSERTRLGSEIFDLVLKLWKHRASYRSEHRPFERYEAIFRALESLDPTNEQHRYFFPGFPPVEQQNKADVDRWLDTAKVIDQAARSLITFCIGRAAACAGQPHEAWLKAAKALKTDDELELKIVLVTSEMAQQHQDVATMKKAELERMLDRVKSFAGVSSVIEKEINRQIAGIET